MELTQTDMHAMFLLVTQAYSNIDREMDRTLLHLPSSYPPDHRSGLAECADRPIIYLTLNQSSGTCSEGTGRKDFNWSTKCLRKSQKVALKC